MEIRKSNRKRLRTPNPAKKAATSTLAEDSNPTGNGSPAVTIEGTGNSKERGIKAWFRDALNRSSLSDWCVAALTLILAGAAIYQYRVMHGQLAEMMSSRKNEERQLDIMQKQMEATSRAWILITDFKPAAYKWFPNGASVYAVATLKNVGNIPATRVYGFGQIKLAESLSFVHPELLEFQKSACLQGRTTIHGRPLGRMQTIYPSLEGKDHPIIATYLSTNDAVAQVKSKGHLEPYLVGCFYFQYSTSPSIHEVPFIYQVKHILANGKTELPKAGENLPLNQISLDDLVNGDAATDNP